VARVWVLTDRRYLNQRMPMALLDQLADRGACTRLVVAEEVVFEVDDRSRQGAEDPWKGLAAGDVVVARTRNPFGLALLRSARRPGVTLLTPWEAIASVRNKPRAAQVLAAHHISAPHTFLADGVAGLKEIPAGFFPLILKPHLGDNALGIAVVRSVLELDDVSWDDAMVLAQRFVDTGGMDTKVYAAGECVWAVRRPSPLPAWPSGEDRNGCGDSSSSVHPIEVTPALRRLARACGEAFGLVLFGVDVLESTEGPLVVDVNDFPNYTGVNEAPEEIAELVLRHLRGEGVACAS
jgi:ribosomal protein S6--L-glutamate ligase